MPRPVLLIHLCLGALLLAGLPRETAASGRAVVRGASSLNVRTGPGRNFPSLDVLKEGDIVEVETTEGSWVHIRLSDGRNGYVHKAFLVPTKAEGATSPTAAREGEPTAASEPRNARESEDAATRTSEPTATAEAREPDHEMVTPTSLDEPSDDEHLEQMVESLQADVKRLLDAAGNNQGSVLVSEPTPTPVWVGVTAVDANESGSLLGLSIIGLVVGFVLGTIYGRRQERGRRTRVRF